MIRWNNESGGNYRSFMTDLIDLEGASLPE
ncbi:hypothetical protein J2T14_001307 [Paenibacillus harenae]|nr:hypothetical protein [Paenibacillus harenae]